MIVALHLACPVIVSIEIPTVHLQYPVCVCPSHHATLRILTPPFQEELCGRAKCRYYSPHEVFRPKEWRPINAAPLFCVMLAGDFAPWAPLTEIPYPTMFSRADGNIFTLGKPSIMRS